MVLTYQGLLSALFADQNELRLCIPRTSARKHCYPAGRDKWLKDPFSSSLFAIGSEETVKEMSERGGILARIKRT